MENAKIVIHVQGGCIVAVFGNQDISVEVVDLDNCRSESESAERQGLEKLADAQRTLTRIL